MTHYQATIKRFENIVKNREKSDTMIVLIIDSPWMPGYMGVDTLDFYFDPDTWLRSYTQVTDDLPGVAFIPGSWVEFGMAAEPSGFGVPIRWSRVSPPSIYRYPGGLTALLQARPPDPEKDGLMPVILRQYERMKSQFKQKGIAPRFAGARGPLAVASHLVGVSELLMATQLEPDSCLELISKTTELAIQWLKAQLLRMDDPVGVLVLDDVVGMMGPDDADKFALPFLKKIFDSFPGLIHIYHNDTPNAKIFTGLSAINMDLFNFSHEIDIKTARTLLGPDIVLMGNIPPVDVLVRGTKEQVRDATVELMKKIRRYGPIIISCGGGVSPGTPIKNLQTMAEVVREYSNLHYSG